MALWTQVTLLGLGTLGVAIVGAVWLGSRSQERALSQVLEPLLRLSSATHSAQSRLTETESLPTPVSAYFRRVLGPGQQFIRLARFKQRGTLRTDVHSDRWLQ